MANPDCHLNYENLCKILSEEVEMLELEKRRLRYLLEESSQKHQILRRMINKPSQN